MKITKFVHSCVLVEDESGAVLFDPGVYSWEANAVDVSTLPPLSAVIISHMHPDHCFEPFVRALNVRFPATPWFAPSDLHGQLRAWGVQNISNNSDVNIVVNEISHARVAPFGAQECRNLVTHWQNAVTHPGDSHEFAETMPVLLLPVQAPWGTTVRAVALALELHPRYVLPIHDWMWRDEWREAAYDRFEQIFAEAQITFLRPIDGRPIEVAVS